jgi:hypothetical protein
MSEHGFGIDLIRQQIRLLALAIRLSRSIPERHTQQE